VVPTHVTVLSILESPNIQITGLDIWNESIQYEHPGPLTVGCSSLFMYRAWKCSRSSTLLVSSQTVASQVQIAVYSLTSIW
jgi:hypothetical protein